VVRPQRADVEFGQLRQIGQHLRHRDQHVADGIDGGRGMIAVAGEQLGDARARGQLAGQRAVQRR
jgi:hypothetical protein